MDIELILCLNFQYLCSAWIIWDDWKWWIVWFHRFLMKRALEFEIKSLTLASMSNPDRKKEVHQEHTQDTTFQKIWQHFRFSNRWKLGPFSCPPVVCACNFCIESTKIRIYFRTHNPVFIICPNCKSLNLFTVRLVKIDKVILKFGVIRSNKERLSNWHSARACVCILMKKVHKLRFFFLRNCCVNFEALI